jgi:hypothetical protein
MRRGRRLRLDKPFGAQAERTASHKAQRPVGVRPNKIE